MFLFFLNTRWMKSNCTPPTAGTVGATAKQKLEAVIKVHIVISVRLPPKS